MDGQQLDRWSPADTRRFLQEKRKQDVLNGKWFDKNRPTVAVIRTGDLTVEKLVEIRAAVTNELRDRGALRQTEPSIEQVLEGIETLQDFKQLAIACALQATKGNKAAAARRLGINIKTLYNMLKQGDA